MESILRLRGDPSFPLIATAVGATVVGALVFTVSSVASTKKGKKKPPHVFSFVPYLGSAIEMGDDITEFIRKYAKKFQSPVFTATIMGDKCVFLADPELSTIVYAPSFQQSIDDFSLQKQFTENVLTYSEESLKTYYDRTLQKKMNSQFHHYISKPEELNKTLATAQDCFIKVVMPEICETTTEWKTVPFAETLIRAVFKGTMAPFISHDLATDEAFQNFKIFDSGIIMLFNQAPAFLTKAASTARGYLLEKCLSAKFWESASPLMKARRELPLSEDTLAKGNVGILWATVGNTAPAIFWMMVCLLAHPEAYKACLDQVQEVDDKKKGTTFSMDDLDKMTLLESAFLEAIRLYSGAFTSRVVKHDFVLKTGNGEFQLEAGSKIMAWWGLLHYDPTIFDSPEQFQFDRFVDKKTFTFQSGKHVNFPVAFGGGAHLCPGRKFASYEARLLCAMMMLRFEMKLVDPIPSVNKALQGIGVSQPDLDPKVTIRLRN